MIELTVNTFLRRLADCYKIYVRSLVEDAPSASVCNEMLKCEYHAIHIPSMA